MKLLMIHSIRVFKNNEEFIQAFKVIPASATILDLGWNNFVYKNVDLAQAFAAIPAGVTTIDLSGNKLGIQTGDKLAKAFKAIPAGVSSLNLRGNLLGIQTGDKLAEAFAAIPAGVSSLNLSYNNLDNIKVNELAKAFKAIPEGVITLDLSCNRFNMKTINELETAFQAMPRGVKQLVLDKDAIHILNAPKVEDKKRLAEALFCVDEILVIDDSGQPVLNNPDTIAFNQYLGLWTKETLILQQIGGSQQTTNPLYQHPKLAELLQYFSSQLQVLNAKAQELRDKGHEEAAACAGELHKILRDMHKGLLLTDNKKIDIEAFKKGCTAAINRARPQLETHRGWKQVLGNLALAFLGLGVLYGIAGLINKAATGHFLFFKTDSANKIDQLQQSLNSIKSP